MKTKNIKILNTRKRAAKRNSLDCDEEKGCFKES